MHGDEAKRVVSTSRVLPQSVPTPYATTARTAMADAERKPAPRFLREVPSVGDGRDARREATASAAATAPAVAVTEGAGAPPQALITLSRGADVLAPGDADAPSEPITCALLAAHGAAST